MLSLGDGQSDNLGIGRPVPRVKQIIQEYISSITKLMRNAIAKPAAAANDRVQTRVCADASRPAPNARQIELKFTRLDTRTSGQPTHPPRKQIVNTGSTANQSVKERTPWARPLA